MMAYWRNRSFLGGAALAAAVLLVFLANAALAEDAAQPPSPPAVAPPQSPPASRPGFIHQLGVWWEQAAGAVDEKIKGIGGKTDNKPDDLKKKSDDAGKSAADATKGAVDASKGGADATKDAAKSAAPAGGDAMTNAVEGTKGAAATATDAVKGAATTATDAVKGAATTAGDAMKGAFEATKNAATSIVKLPNTRVIEIHETCAKAPNGASDCTDAAANGCRGKGFSGGKALEVRTAEKCDTTALQLGRLPSRDDCGIETTVIRAVCQ
jgi:hypothetical protein